MTYEHFRVPSAINFYHSFHSDASYDISSQIMESRDQAGVAANQNYNGDSHTHYAHSQYPYPPTSAPFTMDHDMTMDHFASSVQTSVNNSISEPSASGVGGPNAIPAHASISSVTSSGMAPPQTGNPQPYSPSGPRMSIDDGLDNIPIGGDQKRKRSKVSRACDECRRKKVRCDAAGDDGSIKTCTNCQRAGLICGYNRVPMKRGPSKGYIKELSERVQQVESQMAMTNTPGLPGYRQSLDGSTTGLYTEQLYSPEDPTGFKRFSFSDQRSPFANPEFNRDRIPSVGGWASSSPQASGFRGRDRGSLAIAPDQQSPITSAQLTKPFWSLDTEGPPPSKRRKTDTSTTTPPVLGDELLSKYYAEIHVNFPMLPDADASISMIRKASPQAQHAFCAAVDFVPPAAVKVANGQSNGDSSATLHSTIQSRDELCDFMYNAARENPDLRSKEDNLVYIWIQLLMAIEAENDLTRMQGGPLPKAILIKQTIDLGWHCINKESQIIAEVRSDDDNTYKDHLARAWYCAGILARLHAVAVGSLNPIPSGRTTHLPGPPAVFSAAHVYLPLSAVCLQTVIPMLQVRLPPGQESTPLHIALRDTVLTTLDSILHTVQLEPDAQSMSERIQLFFELLLSRYTDQFHPFHILQCAVLLAEALCKHITTSTGHHAYTPFDMHFFTLTTITLLELTSDGVTPSLTKAAFESVDKIKVVLEQIAERDHIQEQEQEQGQQDGDEMSGQVSYSRPIHWANALLAMIEKRSKAARETTNSNGSADVQETNEHIVAVDFTMLLRYGYLTVLAESVGT